MPVLGSIAVTDESSEVERLRARGDELAQDVLAARDAARGAEAELAVARARIAELEHRLHVSAVEIDELRLAVDAAGRVAPGGQAPGVDSLVRLARRSARALGL
jgi:chromosome condensin MukBEF ATPase and DNA-binding subunit MukB